MSLGSCLATQGSQLDFWLFSPDPTAILSCFSASFVCSILQNFFFSRVFFNQDFAFISDSYLLVLFRKWACQVFYC